MNSKTDDREPTPAEESDAEDREWYEKYPHVTTRAVPVTEATAGVDVTVADVPDWFSPVVFVRHHYPPEDDEGDGDTIMLTGTRQVIDLANTLLETVAPYHDPSPMADVEVDDDEWSPRRRLEVDDGE